MKLRSGKIKPGPKRTTKKANKPNSCKSYPRTITFRRPKKGVNCA